MPLSKHFKKPCCWLPQSDLDLAQTCLPVLRLRAASENAVGPRRRAGKVRRREARHFHLGHMKAKQSALINRLVLPVGNSLGERVGIDAFLDFHGLGALGLELFHHILHVTVRHFATANLFQETLHLTAAEFHIAVLVVLGDQLEEVRVVVTVLLVLLQDDIQLSEGNGSTSILVPHLHHPVDILGERRGMIQLLNKLAHLIGIQRLAAVGIVLLEECLDFCLELLAFNLELVLGLSHRAPTTIP
mmetsp:Transcript_31528/g.61530  ORF Transcript_31528/g.61530 Transcript_31528/m.61530 type:complete len:245 (+) Transcript_31528:339-1073(+)